MSYNTFSVPPSLLIIIDVVCFVWEKQSFYWCFFPPPGSNTGLIQIVVGQDQLFSDNDFNEEQEIGRYFQSFSFGINDPKRVRCNITQLQLSNSSGSARAS